VASDRVRSAFAGFSRIQRMTYPGDAAGWQANRGGPADVLSWRLSQPLKFGPDRAVFGLGGRGAERQLMASASFADGAWPYAARVVIRDVARTPAPQRQRLTAGSPLSGRAPPRQGARIVMAEGRSLADGVILPQGAKTGILFRFPGAAADLLRDLDPREAVTLEFIFSGPRGDQVRSAYIEVGDFTAGRAFLQVARR